MYVSVEENTRFLLVAFLSVGGKEVGTFGFGWGLTTLLSRDADVGSLESLYSTYMFEDSLFEN